MTFTLTRSQHNLPVGGLWTEMFHCHHQTTSRANIFWYNGGNCYLSQNVRATSNILISLTSKYHVPHKAPSGSSRGASCQKSPRLSSVLILLDLSSLVNTVNHKALLEYFKRQIMLTPLVFL